MSSSTGDANQGGAPQRFGVVNASVLNSVVESYYPDAIRAGTTARLRAQAAQSVATAFAAAAVASLTLTNFRQLAPGIRVVGCAAVVAWAAASVLYMRAVGAPAPQTVKTSGVRDPDDLVRYVLNRAQADRESVDKRQYWANAASIAALALTAATFVSSVFAPDYHDEKRATFAPSPDQALLVRQTGCAPGPVVSGKIRMASLRTETLEFTIRCEGQKHLLILPRKDMKGLIVDDD